ncbi:MAG TPA: hypothetical protein VMX94_02685 [Armatimonadota bacterium]|nr:hypothetical protein [Armatimonadota bacterium]
MRATETIPVLTPEIEGVIEELIENGGELTPELEVRLQNATALAEGALELVDRITDLQNFAFNARLWIKSMQLQINERVQIADMLRAGAPRMFRADENGGALTSPVKREDGTSVSYVKARSTEGSIDPSDPALDHETTLRGYTVEQVEESQIPLSMFLVKSVYVPNMELIGKYLDDKQQVGLCRRMKPTSSIRIVHPRSLQAASDKIKRAEAKKRGEFKTPIPKDDNNGED